MTERMLQDRNGVRLAPSLTDEFASELAGQVIRPADPDYDRARRIWNAASIAIQG